MGKLNTPRKLSPSVRVGAMRPINSRGHRGRAARIPAIQYGLHLHGVPGHHDVGEQAERIGHRLHLLGLPGLVAGDATDIDRALEGIDRLAAIEYAQDLAAEGLVDKVVGQKDRA